MATGEYRVDLPDNPTQMPGFEVRAVNHEDGPRFPVEFGPTYYPDRFTQTKKKDLDRSGQQCAGENISVEKEKNREFHVAGVVLERNVPRLQQLLDHEGPVEVISPLTPSGGMECILKSGELGEDSGYDPHAAEWMFDYKLDLVSTGDDEYERGRNPIVSAIINPHDGGEQDTNGPAYGF